MHLLSVFSVFYCPWQPADHLGDAIRLIRQPAVYLRQDPDIGLGFRVVDNAIGEYLVGHYHQMPAFCHEGQHLLHQLITDQSLEGGPAAHFFDIPALHSQPVIELVGRQVGQTFQKYDALLLRKLQLLHIGEAFQGKEALPFPLQPVFPDSTLARPSSSHTRMVAM